MDLDNWNMTRTIILGTGTIITLYEYKPRRIKPFNGCDWLKGIFDNNFI